MSTRYKFQPWYKKAWRQVRYKPEIPFRFAWYVIGWIRNGGKITYTRIDSNGVEKRETRREEISHLWTVAKCHCDYQMENLMSYEEFRDGLLADAPNKSGPT